MLSWILIALMLASPSLQDNCHLYVNTAPFSQCSNEHWGSVLFRFSLQEEMELPMSSICNVTMPIDVIINNTIWLRKGFLHLYQKDSGSNIDGTEWNNWFIESISVECDNGIKSTFGIGRSILTSQWYDFSTFDTKLELKGPNAISQNIAELTINRNDYFRVVGYENGPLLMKQLNAENAYEGKVLATGQAKAAATFQTQTIIARLLPSILANPLFSSIEDLVNFTVSSGFPIPDSIDYWTEDSNFEAQRLQGASPTVIKMVKSIPDIFELDVARAEEIMKERLPKMLRKKKMFLADLSILAEVNFFAPMALFYVNRNKTFKALAIQLTRKESGGNVVFYPDDEANSWLMAKMYYNLAESTHHQLVTHLDESHLLLDAVGALTYQNLLPSHPVLKILKQHFYMMFSNNFVGAAALLGPGGIIQRSFVINIEEAKKLMKVSVDNRNFASINPPLNEKKRKTSRIKVYPYRDRALPLFGEIKAYVTDVLNNYYSGIAPVDGDERLKTWRVMLATPESNHGAAIKGLPGDDLTGVMTFDDLTEIVATFIWQASAGHAAAHLPQYQEYGFVLNYPVSLALPPPSTKNISDADIVKVLPNKLSVITTMAVTYNFLFDGEGGFLGDFDRTFLHSPKDQLAIERFNGKLADLQSKTHMSLNRPYEFLDINSIRNSPRV